MMRSSRLKSPAMVRVISGRSDRVPKQNFQRWKSWLWICKGLLTRHWEVFWNRFYTWWIRTSWEWRRQWWSSWRGRKRGSREISFHWNSIELLPYTESFPVTSHTAIENRQQCTEPSRKPRIDAEHDRKRCQQYRFLGTSLCHEEISYFFRLTVAGGCQRSFPGGCEKQ